MKLIFKKAVVVAIFLLSSQSALVLPTQAQSKSNSSLQSLNESPAISPAKNLELLIKAVRQFITNNSFEMKSNLNIKGTFSGGSVDFFVKINIFYKVNFV